MATVAVAIVAQTTILSLVALHEICFDIDFPSSNGALKLDPPAVCPTPLPQNIALTGLRAEPRRISRNQAVKNDS